MPDIDQVIARSRQPGDFSERKRFSVARSRAIQKMRQFALADTSYYILEWIQAAIANGATYLDLAIEWGEVRMSYVGGGFPREELDALFDFLFASKDDLDVADTRQLALGVNALLNADPDRIVIESGDGTLEGTTRVEIDGQDDSVSVGTPTKPLAGTFVRATGLIRGRDERKELRAIEERCLTAPIPILVNDSPLFGYSSVRSPELFGYRRFLKFDEGDLYGTIGLATTPITRNFKLLTFGAWITSTRYEFSGLPAMGGVVGYDRLRKTADHSGIVQDEVYQEMWARLEPYARQLATGKTGAAAFEIEALTGASITPRQFRELALEQGRAVLFLADQVSTEKTLELAARYGEAFDAPVFLTSERDLDTVKHLGGPEVTVFTPRLDLEELRFYEQPRAEAPERPWLTGTVDVPDIDPEAVADHMQSTSPVIETTKLAREVRASTGISGAVYTPAELPAGAELWVEMRVVGRTVWAGSVSSPYPGHHLVVDLEKFPVDMLTHAVGEAAQLMADGLARQAEPMLRTATRRVLGAMRQDQELPPAAKRIVLAALARSTMKRVRRSGDDESRIRFALSTDRLPDVLLDVDAFETLTGELLSLRDLEERLPDTCGLVYGARRDDELPGEFARDRIFRVDDATEKLVADIIGESCYVRLGDDVELARCGELYCGVTTLGLVGGDDGFPLAVSGDVPADENQEVARALVSQLAEMWSQPRVSPQVRGHLARHLIWFLVNAEPSARAPADDLLLFRAPDGGRFSFADLRETLERGDLPMYDGWSGESSWHGGDTRRSEGEPALAMNPFVLHALSKIGPIQPILDLDLTESEARTNPTTPSLAFLTSEKLSDRRLDGEIGFPMVRTDEPLVLLIDRSRQTSVALRSLGAQFGVVGQVRLETDLAPEDIERRCVAVAQNLLSRLIRKLPSMPTGSDEYVRALEVLLGYARRRLQITLLPDGSRSIATLDATAQRILDLPVFPTTAGVSVTPWRMLREFATFGDRDPRPGRARVVQDAPEVLLEWLDDVLDPNRIAATATDRPTLGAQTSLDRWLTEALTSLRTDDDEEVEVRILSSSEFGKLADRFGVGPRSEMLVHGSTVVVNSDFWLTRNIIDESGAPDPEKATWLLLAIYARVNELRLSVTNMHEMHFQSRIIEWLEG